MSEEAKPEKPLRVVSLTVDSYKRIRAARVEPAATGVIQVRGRMAAGKSSLIGSMLDALGVDKPTTPINLDAHGASVVLDLGEIVIEKRWIRDAGGKARASLVVKGADGIKMGSPAAVLKALRGHFADPVAFLEMTSAQQVKTVLAVAGLDGKLGLLEVSAAALYDTRRDMNRDATRLEKAVVSLRAEVDAIGDPPTGPSLEDLQTHMQSAQAENTQLAAEMSELEHVADRGRAAAALVARLKLELADAETAVTEARTVWSAMSEAIGPRNMVDTVPISDAINARAGESKNEGRRELFGKMVDEFDAAVRAHEEVDEALTEIREEIAELLGQAPFPLPEMSYDPETKVLMYDGLPFEEASSGQRIRAAAAVAMSGNPRIKVLFAREGSLLDDEARAQLAAQAEAAGFQVWLEVVDSTQEGVGLWIEDGEVSDGSQES